MLGAVQPVDALHADGGGARAFDVGAHLGEQVGQVDDFGFARAVLHDGFAFGQHGGHQQVFGSGNGNLVEGMRLPLRRSAWASM